MTRRSIPVTVLTGFLGAGKTTLLNALLRRAEFERTAVVVNEFGRIGIDHLLVDAVVGDMLVLTTGCLCCSARGDLPAALQGLIDRRLDGTIDFDRIIIETTGLADPGPILDALLCDPALLAACRPGGVTTLVDVTTGTALLEHEEAQRQVALADAIVLSKTDLESGPPVRAELVRRLDALNPAAPILESRDLDAVAAVLTAPETSVAPARPGPHDRHRHRHTEIEALCLETGPVDPKRLDAFVGRLMSRHGSSLLRLKGVVSSTADPGRPIVVQAVGSRLFPAHRLAAWPSRDHGTRLVIIIRGPELAAVVDLWGAYFGPPAIDRPDAEALAAFAPTEPGLF